MYSLVRVGPTWRFCGGASPPPDKYYGSSSCAIPGSAASRQLPSLPSSTLWGETFSIRGGMRAPRMCLRSTPGCAQMSHLCLSVSRGERHKRLLRHLIPICIQSDAIWKNSPQRHRGTEKQPQKPRRHKDPENKRVSFHLSVRCFPLCLCVSVVSCFWGFLRGLHSLLPAMFMH